MSEWSGDEVLGEAWSDDPPLPGSVELPRAGQCRARRAAPGAAFYMNFIARPGVRFGFWLTAASFSYQSPLALRCSESLATPTTEAAASSSSWS